MIDQRTPTTTTRNMSVGWSQIAATSPTTSLYDYLEEETPERTLLDYATLICSLFMMVCCVLGLFGNCVSVVIFSRPAMRTSINVLLTGLSVIDILMLVLAVPVFAVPNLTMFFRDQRLTNAYYAVIVHGPYQLGMICQTCSVWLVVLISLERYLAVCHPLKVARYVSVGRARLALVLVVSAACGYNSVRFFEYRLITGDEAADVDVELADADADADAETADAEVPLYDRWLRKNSQYFYYYYSGLYLFTHFLVPFVAIVTLNVLIWRAMKRAMRAQLRLHQCLRMQCSRSSVRKVSKMKTTQMIFLVTAMFGVCNTPPFVLNTWEALEPEVFSNSESPWRSLSYVLVDVSNTLVVFNSATTFLLYICYCKKYRQLLVAYCRMLILRQPANYTRRSLSRDSSAAVV